MRHWNFYLAPGSGPKSWRFVKEKRNDPLEPEGLDWLRAFGRVRVPFDGHLVNNVAPGDLDSGGVLIPAPAGTERGLTRFRAYVLAENHRMLRLLAHQTRIIESKTAQGETTVLFEPL